MIKATMSLAVLCLLGKISAEDLTRQQQYLMDQHNQFMAQKRWEADHEGKYAQKPHHHHHHHPHQKGAIQLDDHKNDTDDLVEDVTFLEFDHENDTDDIPSGLDPFQLTQIQNEVTQSIQEKKKWDDFYAENENDASYEFVQLNFDHENDTEDIPNGLDPVNLANLQPVDEDSVRDKALKDEVNAIVLESGEDSLLQLNPLDIDGTYLMYESHENDTDDISEDVNPLMYDQHHSKIWNDVVNKKALELEQTMKIEENMEAAKIKSKEDAERKASIMKFNEEQEKRRSADQKSGKLGLAEKVKVNPYKTIDLSEVYEDLI